MTSREYPARPIVGVGGVVVQEGRTVLIRRAHPPLQGEWSIPGGALEVGETVREGVARELKEETGLEVRVLDLLEVFERIVRDDAGRVQYHFVILDYLCEATGGRLGAGGDAVDATWASEAELAKFAVRETATSVIRKALEAAAQRVAGQRTKG